MSEPNCSEAASDARQQQCESEEQEWREDEILQVQQARAKPAAAVDEAEDSMRRLDELLQLTEMRVAQGRKLYANNCASIEAKST
jgi:hypothetical protein